jgi:hypothetical protein
LWRGQSTNCGRINGRRRRWNRPSRNPTRGPQTSRRDHGSRNDERWNSPSEVKQTRCLWKMAESDRRRPGRIGPHHRKRRASRVSASARLGSTVRRRSRRRTSSRRRHNRRTGASGQSSNGSRARIERARHQPLELTGRPSDRRKTANVGRRRRESDHCRPLLSDCRKVHRRSNDSRHRHAPNGNRRHHVPSDSRRPSPSDPLRGNATEPSKTESNNRPLA